LIALGVGSVAAWIALPHRPSDPVDVPAVVEELPGDEALAVLLEQGIEAYPELFHAAVRGRWIDGEPLSEDAVALVTTALERADVRTLVPYLARVARGADPDLRAGTVRWIGAHGRAVDVAALLSIGESVPSVGLGAALSALIERDPAALDEMRGRLFRLDTPTLRAAVQAIGGSGRSRALELLVDVLGREPDLDGVVLGEIGRLGAVARPAAAREAARRVRPLIEAGHPGLARAALNALGRLGDPGPVGDMIDMLDSVDRGLARTAYAGLRELTGLRLRDAAGPWRAWYDEQVRWADRELAATLDALRDGPVAVAFDALRELELHPLERHAIAREVALLLEHPEPTLRAQAARTLRRLGSRAATPALIDALADEDATTRESARAALAELLGGDLGPDEDAWREALAART